MRFHASPFSRALQKFPSVPPPLIGGRKFVTQVPGAACSDLNSKNVVAGSYPHETKQHRQPRRWDSLLLRIWGYTHPSEDNSAFSVISG